MGEGKEAKECFMWVCASWSSQFFPTIMACTHAIKTPFVCLAKSEVCMRDGRGT